MKTSCSTWSYHRAFQAGTIDLTGYLDECAALGLDGVELLNHHLGSTDRDFLQGVKKACTDRFLTIAMVSAGGHLTVSDDAKRMQEVQEIARWVDAAVVLGAPRVRFFCGSGPELSAGGDALYAKVLSAMKDVAALGERKGIVMALENHGGTTAEQMLSLVRDVDSEFLKLTLDTGNFPPTSHVGPDTYRHIAAAVPLASIVHAKFFDVGTDGHDAEFDWARIHEILRQANFRGFLSVEYEGDDDNEVAVMRRIVPYLRTMR